MNLKQPDRRFGDDDYQPKLDQYIHCGLCLQACPTYVVLIMAAARHNLQHLAPHVTDVGLGPNRVGE